MFDGINEMIGMLGIFKPNKSKSDPLQNFNNKNICYVNTTTFTWPSATPPTAPTGTNSVRGTLLTDGVLTAQTITHNLGFSTAELAAGLPEVVVEPLSAGQPALAILISSKTANTLVFTFLAAVGTIGFTIRRPQSGIA